MSRAWKVVRRPLSVQHRAVFRFDRTGSIPSFEPAVPVDFTLESIAEGSEGGRALAPEELPTVLEWIVRGRVDRAPAYRMRVSRARDEIARLVPFHRIEEGDAFFYDGETEPSQRGRRIFTAALALALRNLPPSCRSVYSRIHRNNVASIRGVETVGFRRCGSVIHVSLLGRSLQPFGWRVRRRSEEMKRG